jgi:predicted RNA binding protein with dsRBD fold (UPF0201 family)
MYDLKIVTSAEVEIKPTESPEKVEKAVTNLLNNPQIMNKKVMGKNVIISKTYGRDGLKKLYNLFRNQSTRDAARKVLLFNIQENQIIFYDNKQAAYMKHFSFTQPEVK